MGKIVFSVPWFSVDEISPNQHNAKPYYRILSPDGVCVIAKTKKDEIVCIKQYRPAIGKYIIELPAGGIDNIETPLQAGIRELYEETGFVCSNFKVLAKNLYLNPSRSPQKATILFGFNATREFNYQSNEEIETILISVRNFEKMISKGEINVVAYITAFGLAKHHGYL